ncbi:MAG: phosphoenolpyruvate--protein phosphotransferase [Verrucomicrobia bacterium]|nr:phosphoenolpyruvate--protein phosphotransferase [Verrucomicrobiota bacterium]
MAKAHVDLICNIGELAGLFEKSTSLENFLQTAVSIVAFHMHAAVCSVYLYDEATHELVLSANQGLNDSCVGNLRLMLGEGLVGLTLQELRPLRDGHASRNPAFKSVPGIDEERYQAFLAVPIVRGLARVGVLVVQDPVPDYFDQNDTRALQAIAAQLATVIENAKLLIALHRMESAKLTPPPPVHISVDMKFQRGLAVAPGIALGKATPFGDAKDDLYAIDIGSTADLTREDFERSLQATEQQLTELQRQMEERLQDVASMIFSAHILILRDSMFSGAMLKLIDRGQTPRDSIIAVASDYIDRFSASENPRLKEKVQDLTDLSRRLLRNLRPGMEADVDYHGCVIIARDLLPSDILKLVAQRAAGLLLVDGGATSHIAILGRSLQLPMVMLENRDLLSLPESADILIDGDQGTVYINPIDSVRDRYQELLQSSRDLERNADVGANACTTDGCAITVMANINLLSELKLARQMHAEGVGLYRSEFPFIVRNDFPSEEEQFHIYRALLKQMPGHDVVFRTLDVGGDKMLSYFPTLNEANPFLGLRALRFSLRYKDIFMRQLRALLRAGDGYKLQIMFPMVASVDDFVEARDVVCECHRQLEQEQVPHNGAPRLGAMVELPSAIEVAPELAAEADFLSIGGNDLVQYILAVDRTNAQMSDMYVSYHPSILRALKRITDAASAAGKPVSFCGEMATDVRMLPFLIGIGIHRLSVEPRQIPRVRQSIATLCLAETRTHAAHLLRLGRITEIEQALGIPRQPISTTAPA